MTLCDKIQLMRKKCGLSQEELAEKLEVSRQSVSKWEQGQALPEMSKLLLLSELFGVSTDFLLKDALEADPAPGTSFPEAPSAGAPFADTPVAGKASAPGTLWIVVGVAVILAALLLSKGLFDRPPDTPQPAGAFPADLAALRGEIFDCAIQNRFDYVPFFDGEDGAPADATEYLFYAFSINLEGWGEDKGVMTKGYVEMVAREHFGVTALEHKSMWKGWDFDGEKYIAVPSSIADLPFYVLDKYAAYEDESGRIVYEVTARHCNYLDIAVSGDEALAAIRELIVSNNTERLNTINTEFFKFYIDDKANFDKYDDAVVFLEHKLYE
ncbi:MAG TPA: helix-turn-helix transcriptional regulator [Candidatus Acidoferrum sp.]|nr:helix-turn-helix transcriptional regulator [Candidatus Acidoferrum sp.]